MCGCVFARSWQEILQNLGHSETISCCAHPCIVGGERAGSEQGGVSKELFEYC